MGVPLDSSGDLGYRQQKQEDPPKKKNRFLDSPAWGTLQPDPYVCTLLGPKAPKVQLNNVSYRSLY